MPDRSVPERIRPVFPRAAWLVLATLGAAPAAPAFEPRSYALDPVHTRVLFAVEHAGFSKALGTVSGSTGTLVFDRDHWQSARLDVRVPLERLDLGDPKWNEPFQMIRDGEHTFTWTHSAIARFLADQWRGVPKGPHCENTKVWPL